MLGTVHFSTRSYSGGRYRLPCRKHRDALSIIPTELSNYVLMQVSNHCICRLIHRISPLSMSSLPEPKAHVKRTWSTYKEDPDQRFHAFLRRDVQYVGAKKESAEGPLPTWRYKKHEWPPYSNAMCATRSECLVAYAILS